MEAAEVFFGTSTHIYRPKKSVLMRARSALLTQPRGAHAYITIRKDHVALLKRSRWLLLCLAIASPALAYQLLPGQPAKTGSATNGATADPLGRDTPSGTLYGFLQAAQAGNYSIAAQYLQMSAARRQTQGEDVASKLKVVIDRSFSGDLRRISNQPDGTPQEGVPLDKQRVGSLTSGDVDARSRSCPRRRSGWRDKSGSSPRYSGQAPGALRASCGPSGRNPSSSVPGAAPVPGSAAVAVARAPAGGSGGRAPGMAGGSVPAPALVLLGALSQACRLPQAWSSFVRPLWLVLGVARPRHSDGLSSCSRAAAASLPAGCRSGGGHRRQLAALAGPREVLRSVRQRAVLSGRMGTVRS